MGSDARIDGGQQRATSGVRPLPVPALTSANPGKCRGKRVRFRAVDPLRRLDYTAESRRLLPELYLPHLQ